MFSLRLRRNNLWPLGTDRLLRFRGGGGGLGFGGGYNFLLKRLDFGGKF